MLSGVPTLSMTVYEHNIMWTLFTKDSPQEGREARQQNGKQDLQTHCRQAPNPIASTTGYECIITQNL
jgi:hypothetical protein